MEQPFCYGDDVLGGWATRLAAEWRRGRDVYAYFNNDPDAVSTGTRGGSGR